MAKYAVLRIAVDPLGQPISGCLYHVRNGESTPEIPLDVDPFETLDAVFDRLKERLDMQLRLW